MISLTQSMKARTRRAWWVWPVVGVPTAFMYCMSTWALVKMTWGTLQQIQQNPSLPLATYMVLGISTLLIGLSLLMLVEAFLALTRSSRRPDEETLLVSPATA